MSSTLKHLTLGRRAENTQDRAAMLSRLGIAEEQASDLFEAPEAEPAQQVEALAAQPPVQPLAPPQTPAWVSPANDEQTEAAAEQPAFAIPTPPVEAVVEEDPFEAIREKYRNPPKTVALAPGLSLPSSIPLPTSLPPIPIKIAPVGERRRKAGELSVVRKVIWGLSTLAALTIGSALLTGDESSFIVQIFGMLLP